MTGTATLVVRFSALGDVVLTGAVTGGLAPVRYLTHARFAEVAARLPGVVEVVAWAGDASAVGRVGGAKRPVDLHASLRSRLLALRVPGAWRRVDRFDLRRRLRVALKTAPPPPVVERYALAAGVAPTPGPWIHLPERASVPERERTSLVLVPGAAWATKRWPAMRFVGVGRTWDGPVTVLGGPDESCLCRDVADGIGTRARAVTERGFRETFEALARGRVVVGQDTGLTHLAVAAGLRAVVLFGGTTSRDGFWKEGFPGYFIPLEVDLPCRPCARFGRDRCPIGDHLCMDRIGVEQVVCALREAAP